MAQAMPAGAGRCQQSTAFPPLTAPHVHLLILGSMPGRASLQANQYYAHPRNAFWPIVERLFHLESGLGYEERCALLVQQGVAVWDVLMSCTRKAAWIRISTLRRSWPTTLPGFSPRILPSGASASMERWRSRSSTGTSPRDCRPKLPTCRACACHRPAPRMPRTASNASECWRVIQDIR